jgi:hypothetical protein
LRESWVSLQKLPVHIATVQGKQRETTTNCIWGDATTPFKSYGSTERNVLLAHVTKWEDMGCTLGTTPGYLLLLRMHKMQKPRVSQGLCQSYY